MRRKPLVATRHFRAATPTSKIPQTIHSWPFRPPEDACLLTSLKRWYKIRKCAKMIGCQLTLHKSVVGSQLELWVSKLPRRFCGLAILLHWHMIGMRCLFGNKNLARLTTSQIVSMYLCPYHGVNIGNSGRVQGYSPWNPSAIPSVWLRPHEIRKFEGTLWSEQSSYSSLGHREVSLPSPTTKQVSQIRGRPSPVLSW